MYKQIWCGSLIKAEGHEALLISSAARSKSTRISVVKAHEPQVSLDVYIPSEIISFVNVKRHEYLTHVISLMLE